MKLHRLRPQQSASSLPHRTEQTGECREVSLIAAVSLGLFGVPFAAHAEGEGSGDPFPFRAPAIVIVHPSILADTGSATLPDFSSRPGQLVVDGQGTLPPNGSDGAVQTASSLPRGSLDAVPSVMQAQSSARTLAAARPARATHS